LKVREYRIDGEHSNAFTAWKNMGSPKEPSAAQYAELERAGRLAELEGNRRINVTNSGANINLKLPRQAVALLVLQF